jgi:hypothetical protein
MWGEIRRKEMWLKIYNLWFNAVMQDDGEWYRSGGGQIKLKYRVYY